MRSSTEPIGALALGNTAPSADYLQCNGQVLTQATYPDLYTAVGTQPEFTPVFRTARGGTFIDMAYSSGLGLYVAITSNSGSAGIPNIFTSTDAENWNAAGAGLNGVTPTSITWSSTIGLFVICTGSTDVLISADGYSWKQSQVFRAANINYVCASPTLIIVGGSSDLDSSIESVYTSTNGTTWTKRTLSTSAQTVTAMHYSAGLSLYVVGTSTGGIFTSSDGTTWTSRTSNISSQINQFDSYASLIVAVGNAGVISSSPTGVTWTARTVQTARALSGVAYSSTATIPWIATGTNIIMTSTNGTTWLTLNEIATNAVARSNIFWSTTDSKYCLTGAIYYLETSSDLISWTAQTTASAGAGTVAMNTGAYGNNAYVICGDSGTIDSSANGTSWTNRTSNAGSNQLTHVIYAAGTVNLFIVCGAGNIINTSSDGTTWTARTSNVTSTLRGLAFDAVGNIAVAVGTTGAVTSSSNGTTWTSRTSNTGNQLNSVAWNGTTFCAVGNSQTVITSTDGTTWTKQSTTGLGGLSPLWITSDGTSFFAITNQPYCYISTAGVTWSAYPMPIIPISMNWMNSKLVAANAAGDIATSTDGKVWAVVANSKGVTTYTKAYWVSPNFITMPTTSGITKSTDGIIFRTLYTNSPTLNGVTYSASQDKLVAVGNLGGILTSTDSGVTWTPQYSFSTSTANVALVLSDVAYSPSLDLFVAVQGGTAGGGMIITSANGTAWTQQSFSSIHFGDTSAAGYVGSFLSICWSVDLGMFVAVGGGGTVATSTNGTTWTERTSGIAAPLVQVCWNSNKGIFVAVGVAGNLITSTNGTTWTSRPQGLDTNFTAVASLEANGFIATTSIAAATGVLWNSSDGITWYTRVAYPAATAAQMKAFYGSIDGIAFLGGSGMFATKDGRNIIPMQPSSSAVTMNAITYDSTHDKYITVGTPYLATLSRTYTKATQFVLPVLPNTWIKAK